MEDTTEAPEGAAEVISLPGGDKLASITEAARALSNWRKEKRQAAEPSAPEPAAPSADENLAPEANTEAEQPIGETEDAPEAETPIEPPVSWSAEEKERFSQLPPDLQEYVSNREKARDTEISRKQQEYADRMRQLEPHAQAMMQARAQYEQALPMILQQLTSSSEYSDIRTMEDVERLAKDDWPRYVAWDAHTKKVQAVWQQQQEAQVRQSHEYQAQWQNYSAQQDQLFAERVPEWKDPAKQKALSELTLNVLEKDYGFSPEEMANAWNGPFRDHRVQQILLDAARYRSLKKNPPKPTQKPLPPVQRPGAAPARSAGDQDAVKALEQKLERTGSLKDAAALMAARRRAG
jgi:hypothetical protein